MRQFAAEESATGFFPPFTREHLKRHSGLMPAAQVPAWRGGLNGANIAGRMSIQFGLISRTPWVRLPLPQPSSSLGTETKRAMENGNETMMRLCVGRIIGKSDSYNLRNQDAEVHAPKYSHGVMAAHKTLTLGVVVQAHVGVPNCSDKALEGHSKIEDGGLLYYG